ncbi:hypothetical protein C8R43DRAFT_1130681 [Mycena crocata]|nr:hypothetical protein C8R43DRAFT_1130681 [Mycena crocata]
MTVSLDLHTLPKWNVFRLTVLHRAFRLRRHLPPTLTSYLRAKSKRDLVTSCLPDEHVLEDLRVFEVEGILFTVDMSLFRLEVRPPVTHFAQPPVKNIAAAPIVLSDTAENFRFFLWDLQAFPHELLRLENDKFDIIRVVDRLLNITEMATKHDLSSLETHAQESLRQFVLSPYFHSASSAQHCRILSLAKTHSESTLFRDLSSRLVRHILNSGVSPRLDPALVSLAESDPRLHNIRGAIYYRQLIALERHLDDRATAQPIFSSRMDVERRMRFLAAHISLSTLSARVSSTAPPISVPACRSHSACQLAWENMWTRVAASTDAALLGSADVLGKLRAMTPLLKRMVSDEPIMSIECGLAALEAVTTLRNETVGGLLNHFL